jgi:hypothetical protein
MKKLNIIIAVTILCITTACRNRHHTIIASNTNGRYIKLEYSGNIYLTADNSGIKGLSPGGYLKYKTNDESIVAERNNKGQITYEINGGDEQLGLNDNGSRLIAAAVKEILKHPHQEYR